MRRLAGLGLLTAAFVLPFVVMPSLPDRVIQAAVYSWINPLGFGVVVLIVQGLRMWNGDE